METKVFTVLDMTCAACVARVEKAIAHCDGVKDVSVNLAASTAKVAYDPSACTPEKMRQAVENAGYGLIIEDMTEDEAVNIGNGKIRRLKRHMIWAVALSLPVAVTGMFFMDMPYADYIMWALSTPVVFWLGKDFYASAWKQLRHRTANMDTLVASSTAVAYAFSVFNMLFPEFWESRGVVPHVYFEASSVIIAFILLGRWLEEKAKGKTTDALKKLMDLRPKVVTVLSEGRQTRIPADKIGIGDIIVVKPGEKIAVDGVLVEGMSHVNESMLTGEPVPALKKEGDKVFAGTINEKGSFNYKAEKVGSDTVLAHIIQLVRDAQGSKAPVQKLVDRIASVFVPVIMGIAVLAFLLWVILCPENGVTYGILALVTVLIIACPCALGLATPTAIMVGIGKGAENGILIRDAESLETACRIDSVILDKTGTITEGHPSVSEIHWAGGDDSFKDVFFSLESMSEHPLAEAVTACLEGCVRVPLSDFENMAGRGVSAVYSGRRYYAGNHAMMAENGIEPDLLELKEAVSSMEKKAYTIVYFSDERSVIAVAGITDRIKESSADAVAKLKKSGIRTYMLTGDGNASAMAVAQAVGISDYRSGMLPEDKALFVKELQEQGHKVAMVGDGINDSAALATADLGIAMGKGSDIAMDVAKMTIISSDLSKIPDAVSLSRHTVRTIRQNLFWAFIYNSIGVPVAAGALYPVCGFLLNPMIAGLAMAFSSVSVVSNSLRLRNVKLGNGLRGPACANTGESTGCESVSVCSDSCAGQACSCENIDKTNIVMERKYKIEGMMCNNCRMHVEKALNGLEGVKATVTLDPAEATVEFSGRQYSVEELQKALSEAGDYKIS